MHYPLSIGLPLLLSLSLNGLLWAGALLHIEWLNRLALLGIAAGALGVATIALVFYRVLALDQAPWSLSLSLASLVQFLALANSLLFLYSAYVGVFPQWLGI
jgi:hypothetical protein